VLLFAILKPYGPWETGKPRTSKEQLMRAVTIRDKQLSFDEHPDPSPGNGELLVAVRAAGLNNADLIQRAGYYAPPSGSSADIPGLELAGEVVAVGPETRRFAVGDRVMALTGGGAQAQLAVVHERVAMAVPAAIGWPAAGGFVEAFTTAHDALFTQCALSMGERLLVTGAAGGVGVAAVQLAVLTGAEVVASVRDPARWADVAALGAAVIAPDDHGGHGPFDVVLEMFPAANLADDMRLLASGGRISIIAVAGGSMVSFDALALMGARGRVHGSTLRTRSLEDKAATARAVERHVLGHLIAGRVNVPVCATYPMRDADAAYAAFAAGGKFGKIVLTT
jgi:NADPH:quinone reductase